MRRLIFIITGIILFGVVVPISMVQLGYRDRINDVSHTPEVPVALVLGASIYAGKPSTILEDRLLTALELYRSGKVKKIVLSGDNRSVDYNEPTAMKNYLIEKGISESDLVLDYAGRRTYDSCYRLREIFGQSQAIIVTQRFHLPRALYLCNNLGVVSRGVASDRSHYDDNIKNIAREMVASWQAWLDVAILHPTPVLGAKEPIF